MTGPLTPPSGPEVKSLCVRRMPASIAGKSRQNMSDPSDASTASITYAEAGSNSGKSTGQGARAGGGRGRGGGGGGGLSLITSRSWTSDLPYPPNTFLNSSAQVPHVIVDARTRINLVLSTAR